MAAMSKSILAEELGCEFKLSRSDAKDLVDEFFINIKLALESGDAVKLSGFGNFILRDKQERPGRNPKTGEIVSISARRVVTFKPGLKLKTQVDKKNY